MTGIYRALLLAGVAAGMLAAARVTVGLADTNPYATPAKLGEALFHDPNLSKNRTQSCATCHMPARAFSDRNDTHSGNAVSLGDDGRSFGDRNAPSATYAALTPPFHRDGDGAWVGGQFWDGRASTLEDQAGGPPLNPVEMGMADEKAVAARIAERADYIKAFKAFYGRDVMADPAKTFAAATSAIASFERTPAFSPFDSRYDRYLRGEVKFTDQEELGRTLFFSKQFTNCSLCHDVKARDGRIEGATFTSYKYFNIGVPRNPDARKLNGAKPDDLDLGLAANPHVGGDPRERGKFKTPSLRNVAVSAPYMHNGVFNDLKTVILFYNKYNSKKKSRQINPETGQRWAAPEVADNIDLEKLETGPGLDDQRIDALVAFLRTLTDRRFEPLLEK
ncbi:MAG: c-type cytochrome [Rhizobium sp.]|nr:c-type cytochrome [Rhizobium sp.]